MRPAPTGRLPDVKIKPKRGVEVKTIDRPADLPEGAIAVWDLLARQLAIAQRLQPEDWIALEMLCRSVARYRMIQLEIETGDLIVQLINKTKTINLAYKALEIEAALIERGCRHFGLSPATRGALKATNPDQETEDFDDYLASRPKVEPTA